MVSVVKSEWHQVERRYGIEIDADTLAEIYPDLDDDGIADRMAELESGNLDVEDVINDALDADVELNWEYLNDDDWWTDRKGGYEVTYSQEAWEYREEYTPPITHKCTRCKWQGAVYDTEWKWEDDQGNELDEPLKVCPMCDSAVELTEVGLEEEARSARIRAEIAALDDEE